MQHVVIGWVVPAALVGIGMRVTVTSLLQRPPAPRKHPEAQRGHVVTSLDDVRDGTSPAALRFPVFPPQRTVSYSETLKSNG